MSGFKFGGFDLAAGLDSLSDIGGKLQKFKEEVENSIDASIRADRSGTAVVTGGSGQSKDPSPRGAEEARKNDNILGLGDVFRTFVSIEGGDEHEAEESSVVEEVSVVGRGERDSEGADDKDNDDGSGNEAKTGRDEEVDEASEAQAKQSVETKETEKGVNAKETIVSEAVATVADGLEQAAAMHQASKPVEADQVGGAPSNASSNTSSNTHSNPTDDDVEELRALVSTLKESLAARELQLERQSTNSADFMVTAQKLEELQALHDKTIERHALEIEELTARLQETEEKLTKLNGLQKSSNSVASLEAAIRSKDEEIKQIMEEGEALSKKQLAQETMIKQLRAKIKQLNESMERLTHQVEQSESRAEAAESELAAQRERHEEALEIERRNHQRALSDAHALLAAAERREVEAARAGTARKLQDAELQVESLQQTVEQLQEELARVRAGSEEREETLSIEVSELQRKCAQAEARQQELLSAAVPEATAPLLRQLEAMQAAAEQQAVTLAEAETTWRSKLAALENSLASEKQARQEADNLAHSSRMECERLAAQLQEATIAMRSMQEGANRDRLARSEAESALEGMERDYKAVKESLAALEGVYAQQMEALQVQMQAREGEALAKMETLRNELSLANERYDDLFKQHSLTLSGGPQEIDGVTEEHSTGISTLTNNLSISPTSQAASGLQRMVKEVERARDRLAEEVIRLEQETVRGKKAEAKVEELNGKLQEMEARYFSALELLGEREERIEELTSDIEELRDGYKMQLETLADQLVALQKEQGLIKN
jgi:chromosome segregation ATPase